MHLKPSAFISVGDGLQSVPASVVRVSVRVELAGELQTGRHPKYGLDRAVLIR